jgi:hypothetical protein
VTGATSRGVRGDEGQVALLVLVYFLVAGLLVLVVGAATQVHLARGRLLALADAAALDAADALDEPTYYARGAEPGAGVPLTDATVRDSVDSYLALVGAPDRFDAFAVAATTGTPDGVTAQVVLRARVRPPLLPAALARGWAAGVPVSVTSRARAGLLEP